MGSGPSILANQRQTFTLVTARRSFRFPGQVSEAKIFFPEELSGAQIWPPIISFLYWCLQTNEMPLVVGDLFRQATKQRPSRKAWLRLTRFVRRTTTKSAGPDFGLI